VKAIVEDLSEVEELSEMEELPDLQEEFDPSYYL